jgi:hypothetical protein
LLVGALLITTGVIVHKEMHPQWKRYQQAFYAAQSAKARQALAGADKTRRAILLKRLDYLRRPDYRIRQILLDGGRRVDRCTTCHLDQEALEKAHPQVRQFPFEQFGCTECHGGVGRATDMERAHATLRIPRRPLHEYLKARKSGERRIDLFNFGADGRPIAFTGSTLCLRCHLGSHPRHVARWRKLKFQSLDKVREKLKALGEKGIDLDLAQCLDCHTTGFSAGSGRYLEDRVTCESCHGPGGFYADLMAGGKAREGAELARVNLLETRSERVCLNCHRPDRHSSYLSEDAAPAVSAARLGSAPAPALDGRMADQAWETAPETRVTTWRLDDGPPRPGAEVSVRAVYDAARIYFIFRWIDAAPQDQMGRWVFKGSRWRAETKWPDALALDWQAADEVADFKQGGCAVLCHTTGRFADFPRMATRQEGAVVDEWYWNAWAAGRAGRPGDGFLDHRVVYLAPDSKPAAFRRTPVAQSIAHGSDTSGARWPDVLGAIPLTLNVQQSQGAGPGPEFRLRNGSRVPLGSAAITGLKEALPLYAAGRPEQGDSADISGTAVWTDGYWILELSRALRTDSSRDVQLNPAQSSVSFGMALWDGSSGDRHQVATLVTLRFTAAPDSKAALPQTQD